MGKTLKYPVGIQTFSSIIDEGYFYVDKTALVYHLANSNKYVFLSRPRRFGKSLLMSTLDSYFKGKRELFEGLEIEHLEKDWIEHPVFRLDLSPTNYDHPDKLISLITRHLDYIESVYAIKSASKTIADRFAELIRAAHEKYGKKVVVLIDEYDKPLLDCLHVPEINDKIKRELRGFYSVIKASDEYLRFAMLTGITRFSKVAIFSGLNNLKDISMLPGYNAICGITETEFHCDFGESVKDFAASNDMEEEDVWRDFKKMYDGYRFARKGEFIYNPFSVLSAFDIDELKSFWYSSGSSSYIIKLIETHTFRLDNIEGQKYREEELCDIDDAADDLCPLLYQSGYLTIKDYDASTKEYTLGFPNTEVREAFWRSLVRYYFRANGGGNAFDVNAFVKDVYEGHPDDFMRRLQSLFADLSSANEPDKEIHFQNMMAVITKMVGLTVHTEVHSSAGRCDMQIMTPSFVYIFEFKINGSPTEALKQIHDKGYARPFGSDARTVYTIGANFSTATRTLTGWEVEKA